MLGRPKFKKWWGPPKTVFSVLSLITNGTILRPLGVPPQFWGENALVGTCWWGRSGGEARCGGETPLWSVSF